MVPDNEVEEPVEELVDGRRAELEVFLIGLPEAADLSDAIYKIIIIIITIIII